MQIIENLKFMTQVRAKFICDSITDYGETKTAKLSAVTSSDGDNEDFTKYTPMGSLEIMIYSDAPASVFFEPRKKYYMDFTAADQ